MIIRIGFHLGIWPEKGETLNKYIIPTYFIYSLYLRLRLSIFFFYSVSNSANDRDLDFLNMCSKGHRALRFFEMEMKLHFRVEHRVCLFFKETFRGFYRLHGRGSLRGQ